MPSPSGARATATGWSASRRSSPPASSRTVPRIVGEAELLLEPVADELVVVRPIGFEPLTWVRALAAEARPDPAAADASGGLAARRAAQPDRGHPPG